MVSSKPHPAEAPLADLEQHLAPGRNPILHVADLLPFQDTFGLGEGRARTELGSYYTTSVSVYSAVKLRSDAVSRARSRGVRRAMPVRAQLGRRP